MSQHVTIQLDENDIERAQKAAEALGVSTEEFLRQLITANLPIRSGPRVPFSAIFPIGSSDEPTDISKDKDKMISEAVWEEYLRETGQK
jgi:Ribbon-helix-helix protein, copG family